MDLANELLKFIHQRRLLDGKLRGLFHVMIGREIIHPSGKVISHGLTWRELAKRLAVTKYNPQHVLQLQLDPIEHRTRDTHRFWYSVIQAAKPDSPQARAEAELLIASLEQLGYRIGPAPQPTPPSLSSPPENRRSNQSEADSAIDPTKPKPKRGRKRKNDQAE